MLGFSESLVVSPVLIVPELTVVVLLLSAGAQGSDETPAGVGAITAEGLFRVPYISIVIMLAILKIMMNNQED